MASQQAFAEGQSPHPVPDVKWLFPKPLHHVLMLPAPWVLETHCATLPWDPVLHLAHSVLEPSATPPLECLCGVPVPGLPNTARWCLVMKPGVTGIQRFINICS